MRNILSLIAAGVLIFAAPVWAAGKPVVKIGVSAPLTGDAAHIGEGLRQAMTLARDNLPADTKYDYHLVFEDDMLDAKRAATAANKLINVDKVDAIVSISSGTGGVVSPIAGQSRLVHFGIASAQDVADGDYNFIHWTPPAGEARVMVQELQKRGIKSISAMYLNQQGVMAIRDELNKEIAAAPIKIISDQTINAGEKDFRTAIEKAKAGNPDLYLVIFFTPELEIIIKQLHEAGIGNNITSIEAFGITEQKSAVEGLWYVDSAEADTAFSQRFHEKFGKDPAFGSANGYDVFNLIVRGYEKADAPAGVKPSQDSVIKALHQVKGYKGALGKLTIDEKGVVLSPAAVKVIKDGKSVTQESLAQSGSAAAVEPAAAE
jgi:branched-chain amino acid transport system substrate-binding protein